MSPRPCTCSPRPTACAWPACESAAKVFPPAGARPYSPPVIFPPERAAYGVPHALFWRAGAWRIEPLYPQRPTKPPASTPAGGVDTGAENIARLLRLLRGEQPVWTAVAEEAAHAMEALVAEREALIADNARLLDSVTQESNARAAAEAERKPLRAQVERQNLALREAGRLLAAARQELESAHAAAEELAALKRGEEGQ